MATKTTLQNICIDASQTFLSRYDIREWASNSELRNATGIHDVQVGADIAFPTQFRIEIESESNRPRPVIESTSVDFAVWGSLLEPSDEFREQFEYKPPRGAGDWPDEPSIKFPIIVAAIVGDDYSEMHQLSTSDMKTHLDEADSPHTFKTNLPFLEHYRRLYRYRQIFISDYPLELVPAHADCSVNLASQSGNTLDDDHVRFTVQHNLACALKRLSGSRFDVVEEVEPP